MTRRGVSIALALLAVLVAPRAIAFPHVVRPGETLAQIAARLYGDAKRESLLAGANALIVGNYLTTTGRTADEDQALLEALGMPVATGPGDTAFTRIPFGPNSCERVFVRLTRAALAAP